MNVNKFNNTLSEDGRVFIGRKDSNNNMIKELDVLEFSDNRGIKEYYFIEYDNYYCSFRMRSSIEYKSSRDFKNGGKIVGCILDFELPNLESKKDNNTTTTYQKWSKQIGKEVLKQMGIK